MKNNRYVSKLNKFDKQRTLYNTTKILLEKVKHQGRDHVIYDIIYGVISPVLVSYVLWIISKARQQNMHKLYFVARDGYILERIAKMLLKALKIDIECQYLYCSRMSLRTALFNVNENLAYEYLFEYHDNLNLIDVFNRIQLPKKAVKAVISALDIETHWLKTPLTKDEFVKVKTQIVACPVCREIIGKHSKVAYENTVEYFKSIGLLNGATINIVDVGWQGTIQKCVRLICQHASKVQIKLSGFYFGIISSVDSKDGTYYSYYFKENEHPKRYVHFNINIFECFCSADHGMTLGYKKSEFGVAPVLDAFKLDSLINKQIAGVVQYTKQLVWQGVDENLLLADNKKLVYKLLSAFMVHPKKSEAERYGRINFCDDTTDLCKTPLVQQLDFSIFCTSGIFSVLNKKTSVKISKSKIFWLRGSVAQLNFGVFKLLFKLNLFVWDAIKCLAYTLKMW